MSTVAFVVESHRKWACINCGDLGDYSTAIWLGAVDWAPGRDPVGPPTFVLCDDCWAAVKVGQLVGATLTPPVRMCARSCNAWPPRGLDLAKWEAIPKCACTGFERQPWGECLCGHPRSFHGPHID